MAFEAALNASSDAIELDYFDGQRPMRQTVQLRVQGDDLVLSDAGGERLRVKRGEVTWPHRHQRGQRIAHLPGAAVLQARDAQAWDAWVERHGLHRDLVGQWQSRWRAWATAMVLLVAVGFGLVRWGLPWGANAVSRMLPDAVAQTVGEHTMAQLTAHWLKPSNLDAETQARWRERLDASARVWAQATGQPLPAYELHFMAGGPLGANALALPNGAVIITDELLQALAGHDTVVLGVLAHELTHVRERHVMRQLVQASLLGVGISAVTGDFSALITTAATLAGASHYSREFEREADDGAIAFLRANGWSPAEMTVLFEQLQRLRGTPSGQNTQSDWGIAFASHPNDSERVQRFNEAAGR